MGASLENPAPTIEAEIFPLAWHHIREASDLDWGGWEGWTDNRLKLLPMICYAGRDRDTGALLGVGGVIWFGKRAFATLAITPGYLESQIGRAHV